MRQNAITVLFFAVSSTSLFSIPSFAMIDGGCKFVFERVAKEKLQKKIKTQSIEDSNMLMQYKGSLPSAVEFHEKSFRINASKFVEEFAKEIKKWQSKKTLPIESYWVGRSIRIHNKDIGLKKPKIGMNKFLPHEVVVKDTKGGEVRLDPDNLKESYQRIIAQFELDLSKPQNLADRLVLAYNEKYNQWFYIYMAGNLGTELSMISFLPKGREFSSKLASVKSISMFSPTDMIEAGMNILRFKEPRKAKRYNGGLRKKVVADISARTIYDPIRPRYVEEAFQYSIFIPENFRLIHESDQPWRGNSFAEHNSLIYRILNTGGIAIGNRFFSGLEPANVNTRNVFKNDKLLELERELNELSQEYKLEEMPQLISAKDILKIGMDQHSMLRERLELYEQILSFKRESQAALVANKQGLEKKRLEYNYYLNNLDLLRDLRPLLQSFRDYLTNLILSLKDKSESNRLDSERDQLLTEKLIQLKRWETSYSEKLESVEQSIQKAFETVKSYQDSLIPEADTIKPKGRTRQSGGSKNTIY